MAAQTKPVSEPECEREYVVTRVFNAPARLVFAAWSTTEHIKQWFGPAGFPVTMAEIDFRVGGKWRFAMTGPSGDQNAPFGGEYLEIVPNRKISFSNSFETPNAPKMVMTVTFDEKDGKTTMAWRTVFASIAMRKSYLEQGFNVGVDSGLDQLADLLKTMR
jgi:uncharacterized protein YndB with AHSA1/START domain